jgi:hypothetical protein
MRGISKTPVFSSLAQESTSLRQHQMIDMKLSLKALQESPISLKSLNRQSGTETKIYEGSQTTQPEIFIRTRQIVEYFMGAL